MTATEGEHAICIQHRFAAPPHTVYRAWVDPGLVRLWMAPGGQEVTRAEIDERPGGAWRTWKADNGVIVGGFDSELLELVPEQRLAFRWGFIGPQRREGPSFDTLQTVGFDPGPSGSTVLRLVHERKLGPGQQALLTLAYLRKGEAFADLAAGFGTATARWPAARRPEAVTLDSKIVNSVAARVSSRHLRRPDRNRFARQSSGPGSGAGCVRRPGPMTASSFPVQRKITKRSYDPPAPVTIERKDPRCPP